MATNDTDLLRISKQAYSFIMERKIKQLVNDKANFLFKFLPNI